MYWEMWPLDHGAMHIFLHSIPIATKTCKLAHATEQGPSTLSICLSVPHNKMWLFVMCTLTRTLLIRGASGAHVHCMPQTRHAKSLCSNFLRRSMNMMPSTATSRTSLPCANSYLWTLMSKSYKFRPLPWANESVIERPKLQKSLHCSWLWQGWVRAYHILLGRSPRYYKFTGNQTWPTRFIWCVRWRHLVQTVKKTLSRGSSTTCFLFALS